MGEEQKAMEDLKFRLDWWGNLHYEDGCKYAHDILLDHRERLSALLSAAPTDPLYQAQEDGSIKQISCSKCEAAPTGWMKPEEVTVETVKEKCQLRLMKDPQLADAHISIALQVIEHTYPNGLRIIPPKQQQEG